MWLPAAVFVGVVALIVGAYWFFILQEESRLIGRLAPQKKTKSLTTQKGFLKTEKRLSSVDSIDRVLVRASGISVPLKAMIDQAGLKLTVGTFMLASACTALAAYFLTAMLTHNPVFGLLAAVPAAGLPYMYVRRARTKRLYKFEEQFPEAIDLIARALRAGHALPTGLSMVADELPAPVGVEFRTLYDEQNFGLTLPDALRNFASRVAVLDARFFVTAVMTQREAGGNLAEVLDNLSAVIRERFKIKRQVRVISAHGRITGWILAGLPPSVAAASFALNPHHLQVLMGDEIGIRMIETAIVMQVLGTLIIRKIVDVEYLIMTGEFLLTLVAVFGTVALISGSLAWLVLSRAAPGRRRMRQSPTSAGSGVLLDTSTTLTSETSDVVKRLTTLVPKSPKDMTRLRRQFVRAGYQSLTPIAVFSVSQLACPVLFGGALLIFAPPFSGKLLACAFTALIGFQIPSFVLGRLIKARQKVITNGLPDVLDLLIVCLEAGSSLDQALLKASDELAITWPALAEELKILLAETRAGKPRLEAFRNFADRTGVDDVRSLVAMLIQTDRFGTSVAQALRTHAESSRTKRRQRAEERAAKIGVKLVFPLVFLLFPAFFVVTLGPAVIQFIRVFFGQVMGQ